MKKRILVLSFYFRPDLSAGSFRNSTLIDALYSKYKEEIEIDVITTQPNRYATFKKSAKKVESIDSNNLNIYRIELPKHNNGLLDQIFSYVAYYKACIKQTKNNNYDIVYASSGRLFTAFLGYRIASKKKTMLYLDIRDIFKETINDVLSYPKIFKSVLGVVIGYIEKKTFNYATHINLISEGFKPYFKKYKYCDYSYFTNGIDEIFLNSVEQQDKPVAKIKKIVYAGNIGQGQGLEKIIPLAAKKLGENYQFIIIGDGGTKNQLVQNIEQLNVKNVLLKNPIERGELNEVYNNADYLFLHLNDYPAFKKVLPSKLFEYASFNKPIIAGVGGYALEFIKNNIDNTILFAPGDVDDLVNQLENFSYNRVERNNFKNTFSRKSINEQMANSIINTIKK